MSWIDSFVSMDTEVVKDKAGGSEIKAEGSSKRAREDLQQESTKKQKAIQKRLTTQDKFKRWGEYAMNRCNLCCQDSEDINHLIFQCSFSSDLRTKVKGIADIKHNSFDLMNIIQFLIDDGNGYNIKSIIKRIAFAASIYNIWQERNGRIFMVVKRDCDEVFNNIVDKVKKQITWPYSQR
uniref:Reverse transcriptase zinc-binding domain-containing protein n=1 Tax=Tanacetum cinerariifolium TaxID=118510 RepID=A0A6L2J3I1_TANCI|nr:reverse transcriptase zinc-binding domain-containing protein [Tanacetum cinerariifolium]